MIVGAHLTTVWVAVVMTVRVVRGSAPSEVVMLELWSSVNAAMLLLFSKTSLVVAGAGRVELLIEVLLTVDDTDELLYPGDDNVGKGMTVEVALLFKLIVWFAVVEE